MGKRKLARKRKENISRKHFRAKQCCMRKKKWKIGVITLVKVSLY